LKTVSGVCVSVDELNSQDCLFTLTMPFSSAAEWIVPEAASYVRSFLGSDDADRLLETLLQATRWAQHTVRLFGKTVNCPRLSAWHGDETAVYSYSGMTLSPEPWTPVLLEVKSRVESATESAFNSVLLNLYRSGQDSMGWHADDEVELGARPTIASVSLGAVRRFRIRRRGSGKASESETVSLDLEHGSLLVMMGTCQKEWQHAVPKTSLSVGPRINLTFRRILKT